MLTTPAHRATPLLLLLVCGPPACAPAPVSTEDLAPTADLAADLTPVPAPDLQPAPDMTCAADEKACGAQNTCTVITTDDNCGDCGVRCEAGSVCSSARTCVPTSLLSPGGDNPTGVYARPVAFTLATERDAVIRYTLDGSEPTPGGAATREGQSPLTLPALSADTALRWAADYGAAGRERPQRLDFRIDTGKQQALGVITERVAFDGSGGPLIVAAPGAALAGKVDYQGWASMPSSYCPTCVIQYIVGLDSVGAGGCVNENVPPVYPGRSGQLRFALKAPTQPGSYVLRAGRTLDFSCKGAYPGGQFIGKVIVR